MWTSARWFEMRQVVAFLRAAYFKALTLSVAAATKGTCLLNEYNAGETHIYLVTVKSFKVLTAFAICRAERSGGHLVSSAAPCHGKLSAAHVLRFSNSLCMPSSLDCASFGVLACPHQSKHAFVLQMFITGCSWAGKEVCPA